MAKLRNVLLLRVTLTAIAVISLIVVMWWVPRWQVKNILGPDAEPDKLLIAENDYRKTLAQIMGGTVVILSLWLTWRRLSSLESSVEIDRGNQRLAEQGQITERLTKAVELLGHTELQVRLGGVYALERIAADSERDIQTVISILAWFVRVRSHAEPAKTPLGLPEVLAGDMGAALEVISRQVSQAIKGKNTVNLTGVQLQESSLENLSLQTTILTGASFDRAQFNSVDLRNSSLAKASFDSASLYDVYLDGADLFEADFSSAKLTQCSLDGTKLLRANFENADLEYTSGLRSDQIKTAFINEATRLPKNIRR